MGFTTKVLHPKFGYKDKYGALRCPIYQNAAFEFDSAEDIESVFKGEKGGHTYTRASNPSIEELELKIKSISGSFGVVATSSGMSAIANTLFALLKSGDNIITTNYLFGHTLSLFKTLFNDFGIEVRYVDISSISEIEKSIDSNTKVIFCESISNPQLIVPDFLAISTLAKDSNIIFVVDTTMTPWNLFNAKKYGIDIEILSATKYISGGGSVVGGLIVEYGSFNYAKYKNLEPFYKKFGPNAFIAKLKKETFRNIGSALSAHSAYMLSLGIETLDLRVNKSCDNALTLAHFLQTLPMVTNVNYPLLEDSKYYEISKAQFTKGGAILTFCLSDKKSAYEFLNRLTIIKKSTNIQDNKSLAIAPYHTIYAEYTKEARDSYGLSEGMIRLSVGIEDVEDLIEDIKNALS